MTKEQLQRLAELEIAAELLSHIGAELRRIDKTSTLPDGDGVSVCVALWAKQVADQIADTLGTGRMVASFRLPVAVKGLIFLSGSQADATPGKGPGPGTSRAKPDVTKRSDSVCGESAALIANASVTGAAKPRTVDAVLDTPCTEQCALGDLGHCGRTDRERQSHCEKRFNAKLPQLSNAEHETRRVAT
jgi:hypothetical protein